MSATEGLPPTESENKCKHCDEPQQIPLSYDDLCLNCFGFRYKHGVLPPTNNWRDK